MKDLSLHILDIVQNSTRAQASLVEIGVEENTETNLISIFIKDNGTGMPPEMVEQVSDPFVTSRTTRKVGMGIPLFKQSAEQSGGHLNIFSELGVGTTLVATFKLDNIDTPPLGDLSGVIAMTVSGNPNIDFIFSYKYNNLLYEFDTREIKQILGNTPITEPKIAAFLRDMIKENIEEIKSKSTL